MIKKIKTLKNETPPQSHTTYAAIDILKFISAMLVVIIHFVNYSLGHMATSGIPPSGADAGWLILYLLPASSVLLRIAVPFFFISSAFFLFKKIKEQPENARQIIIKYVQRIGLLLLLWFVLALPIVIDQYIIVSDAPWYEKLGLLITKIFFRGGIGAYWYLIALAISVVLVYALSKKLSSRTIFLIAAALYLISCLSSTYINALEGTFIHSILDVVSQINSPAYSFFSGMIFVSMGKYFAEREFAHRQNPPKCSVGWKMTLAILPIFMWLELFVLNYMGVLGITDSFITLAIFSFFLFGFLLSLKTKPRKIHIYMRKSSVLIYMSHDIILYVLYRFVNAYGWSAFSDNYLVIILTYFGTIAASIGWFALTHYLSKKKRLHWLQYAY